MSSRGTPLHGTVTDRSEGMRSALSKARTGIHGLDQITGGGLPAGRPTLVCGSAGCGKTLLAMEFLVRGAAEFDEPGVFVSFEETPEELAQNVASLGFHVPDLVEQDRLRIDHVAIQPEEMIESGAYDLDGLFVRLGFAIDSIGARRVVLDTIETLFGGLENEGILRAELVRLFRWLKDRGVTAVITAERGDGTLTRHGLEEYVSDCVLLLDHRVQDQVSTRRLRIVKYRGSAHGTNEYPFLIDARGMSVLPLTSVGLAHEVSTERVSSGLPQLDEMLDGRGFYRGSSVLLSGTAGTGKSTVAARFLDAVCRRGERALLFAFEESPAQVVRNMRSTGLELEKWIDQGLLQIESTRPTLYGVEHHLVHMDRVIREWEPSAVVVDPITNLVKAGDVRQAESLLLRLVDELKSVGITGLFTALTHGGAALEATDSGISSLMDTWLLLRDIEIGGERNRGLYVLKSRGMGHSNQIREFRITSEGIELIEVYTGPEGVLTGSARIAQEARERSQQEQRSWQMERRRRELERKEQALEARIQALRSEFESERDEMQREIEEANRQERAHVQHRVQMAVRRGGDEAVADDGVRTSRTRGLRRSPGEE